MPRFLSDTSPDAEAVMLRLMREAPVWRRMALMAQLNETVKLFALAGLRERYPRATEAELRRRLADLLLGPELAARAYGPLPKDNGS